MLLPLFEYLSDFFGPFRVVEFLSTRAILATLTSLLFSLVLGPKFINKMRDFQVGQVVRTEGPQSHLSCLLYTSPSPRDRSVSRMPSSA